MTHLSTFIRTSVSMLLVLGVLSGVFATLVPTTNALTITQGGTAASNDLSDVSARVSEASRDMPSCWGGLTGGGFNIKACMGWAAYYIMSVAANIAIWTSGILNYVVDGLIVKMGAMVGNMTGLADAWEVLRDIANVFLVFLTIFVGIATIVGISGYGYKQLLWRVVLAALLVNFSLTFTKFIIDVSNLATIEIYTLILDFSENSLDGTDKSACTNPTIQTDPEGVCIDHGIAAIFWDQLRIMTLFNPEAFMGQAASTGGADESFASQIIIVGILGTILFLVLAFVMAAAAFLLVARFVILLFLLVVSPIALVAWITGTGRTGAAWWNALLRQSFFAPFMFLLWWIALRVLTGVGQYYNAGQWSTTDQSLANSAVLEPASWGLISYFVIVIAFLVASLILAKKMGAMGASAVTRTGASWSKRAGLMVGAGAGAATAGLVGWGARKSIGKGGDAMANNESLKKMASSNSLIARNLGKLGLKTGKKVGGASFDARGLSKDAQKYAGTAKGKGGRTQWRKNKEKKIEELNKDLLDYQGTHKERAARDTAVHKVEGDTKKAESLMVEGKLDSTIGELGKHIDGLEKKLASTSDPAQKEKLRTDLDKSKKEKEGLSKFAGAHNKRIGLEKQLQEAKDPIVRDGLKRDLDKTTETVKSYYGLIDKNVAGFDVELDAIEKEMEGNLNEAQRKTLTAKRDSIQAQRDTVVNHHESKSALERQDEAGPEHAAMTQQHAANEAKLQEQQRAKQQAIDRKFDADNKAKGRERSADYLTSTSKQKTFGVMPWTPEHKRRAVSKIRATQGKTKKEKAIEDILKDIESGKFDDAKTTTSSDSNTT